MYSRWSHFIDAMAILNSPDRLHVSTCMYKVDVVVLPQRRSCLLDQDMESWTKSVIQSPTAVSYFHRAGRVTFIPSPSGSIEHDIGSEMWRLLI